MTFPPLDEFFERSLTGDWFPTAKYIPTYDSPCTFGPIDSESMVQWRPIARDAGSAEIEDATQFRLSDAVASPSLQTEFVTEASDFVTSHWCGPLDCRFGYERVVLDCGAWNSADLKRKQVAFQDCVESPNDNDEVFWPVAWSISGSGQYVGLNLSNGELWSAELESGASQKLADSMSDFLCGLRFACSETNAVAMDSFE